MLIQNIRHEIVPDPFDLVTLVQMGFVQTLRHGKDAPMWIGRDHLDVGVVFL